MGCGLRRGARQGARAMYASVLIVLILACQCLCLDRSTATPDGASFSETLHIHPFADGRVHTQFTFELQSPWTTGKDAFLPTYSYVPRSLVHLALASDADEVHLAINAGRWNYDIWGVPVAEQMVGTGAEVRAVIRTDEGNFQGPANDSSLLARTSVKWRKLTAGLAGLFCASLDALDEKITVLPFDENGEANQSSGFNTSDRQTLQATLASESICTENLSTLLKLLPCKSMAGLASLLKPHQFFLADFHGLALHLTRQQAGWNVKINVQAVFSPALRPGARLKRDWSFERLFSTRLNQGCPLVESSSITVHAPPRQRVARDDQSNESAADFRVWPIVMHPAETADIDENEDLSSNDKLMAKAVRFANNLQEKRSFTFDTRFSTNLNVEMQWPSEHTFTYPAVYDKQKLSVSRILSGYGQERGTVELTIRNNGAMRTRHVTYHEVLPWFVKPYLHTLTATVTPDEYDEEADNVVRFADDVEGPTLVHLNYTPSLPRQRPFHLQAELRIPPQSTVNVGFAYEKAFMQFAEHPPDAHRGFDVAPAVVELEDGTRLYTQPALVEVAVPDFSMPYNVIIFTSTLIALCAGSALNNLVRSYIDVVDMQESTSK